jgi:hypothetical protein
MRAIQFSSLFAQASKLSAAMVSAGLLEFEANAYGGQYIPTSKARDFVMYGQHAV